MDAIGKLGLKKNIGGPCFWFLHLFHPFISPVGVLALAENAIGSKAYKPMDIIQSRKGTMVEIGNTDAEGRLALADGWGSGDFVRVWFQTPFSPQP